MKTLVDALLRTQAKAYALRFACEDCVHFRQDTEACSFGYPASPRRSELDAATIECTLEFCKSFELA